MQLVDMGCIYNTIDDFHFKSAGIPDLHPSVQQTYYQQRMSTFQVLCFYYQHKCFSIIMVTVWLSITNETRNNQHLIKYPLRKSFNLPRKSSFTDLVVAFILFV